jgi:diguanylate cyclase (GGDEF)-like protein
LLIEVANTLQSLSRGTDTVARLGGDEFAVICTVINQRDDIALPATRLVEEIQKPICIEEHMVQIGASIGASIYPDDADTMSELIRKADQALYRAKDAGRNTYRMYDAGIDI